MTTVSSRSLAVMRTSPTSSTTTLMVLGGKAWRTPVRGDVGQAAVAGGPGRVRMSGGYERTHPVKLWPPFATRWAGEFVKRLIDGGVERSQRGQALTESPLRPTASSILSLRASGKQWGGVAPVVGLGCGDSDGVSRCRRRSGRRLAHLVDDRRHDELGVAVTEPDLDRPRAGSSVISAAAAERASSRTSRVADCSGATKRSASCRTSSPRLRPAATPPEARRRNGRGSRASV